MTDELTIQQRRPSAMPYVLGGAAVGGLGGYYGLPKVASNLVTEEARYKTFEDLVKAASDKDAFVRTIDAAEGKEKEMLEKMKGVGDKIKNAEAEWQKGLDKALKDKNLDTAIYETVTEVVGEGTKKTPQLKTYLDNQAKMYYEAAEKFRTATTAEAKEAAKKQIERADKYLDNIIEQLTEKAKFTGTEDEIKAAKEAFAKKIKEYRSTLVDNLDYKNASGIPIVKDYLAAEKTQKASQKLLDEACESLGEIFGKKNFKELYAKDSTSMIKFAERQGAFEVRNQDILTQLKDKLVAAGTDTRRVTVNIEDILQGKFEFQLNNTTAKEEFLKSLTDADKKALKKLFGDSEVTIEKLDELLKASKDKMTKIETATATIKDTPSILEKGKQKLKDLARKVKEQTGGNIRDGKLVGTDPKKMQGLKGKAPLKANLDFLPEGIKPETIVEYVSGGKTTTKQVLKENLSDEAKKVVEEYTKANGSKEDAVKKVTEGLKDDVKDLYGRIKNNKKLLWGTAAVAAVGVALALMLRPKAKEQQA